MIPLALAIVVTPCLAAIPAYLLRRWRIAELMCALISCTAVCLALLVANSDSNAGASSFLTTSPVLIFGRSLQIHGFDQYMLLALFASSIIIFGLSWRSSNGWTFVPIGLVVLGLLSAAIIVRPFIFSILLMEVVAALVALMIQAEHIGERSTLGAIRFLAVTTIALPALIAANYLMNQGSESLDAVLQLGVREPASLLLALGFVLLMGAFPLYTWTHTLTRDAPPIVTAFVATCTLCAVPVIVIAVQQEIPWLQGRDSLPLLRTFGILSIVFGGALAWAQRSFARVLACAISVESGASLLLLQLGTVESLQSLVVGMMMRSVSLGVLAIGLDILRASREKDDFKLLRGAFHAGPSARVAAFALATGGLSLAGLPGTAGFLSEWLRSRAVASTDPELAALMLVAGASIAAGFLRGISAMLARSSTLIHVPVRLRRSEFISVAGVAFSVVILGLAPQWVLMLARVAGLAIVNAR